MKVENNIRLSVIIPGFNTPREWWSRVVQSARVACGPADEIICVDDGSKERVLENWVGADIDERVRLVRKKNGGLASARNAGLELMRGKYVTFVDSDDEIRPETFERCINALKDTSSDIAVYGVEVVWVNDGLHKIDMLPARSYGELTPDQVLELHKANLLNYACNKVYRVDFIAGKDSNRNENISFLQDGMPCEDIIFNLNCIMAGAKWVNVEYAGYIYYRTDGTLLSSYNPYCGPGIMAGARAWKAYAMTLKESERESFRIKYEFIDLEVIRAQWVNIWRRNTPFSLIARWQWLKRHPELGGMFVFVKTAIFFVARRYLYIRPIRRWHLMRLYPNVVVV